MRDSWIKQCNRHGGQSHRRPGPTSSRCKTSTANTVSRQPTTTHSYIPLPQGDTHTDQPFLFPPPPTGNIVRVGPNYLSFATPEAYRDIYGHVTSGNNHNNKNKRFLKSSLYERAEPMITNLRDPAAHAAQRRALSHAFSARALRDQEGVVHRYVDLLVRRLGDGLGGGGGRAVNATDAYNWLTFDVIGLWTLPRSAPPIWTLFVGLVIIVLMVFVVCR